jgi:hypothetical protein
MVDVEGVEEIEALNAYVVIVDEVVIIPYCLWGENYYLFYPLQVVACLFSLKPL